MTEMTNTPEFDTGLAALWQSGGDVDVGPLIKRLQDQNRKLRRINQISFAICIAALVIIVALESLGNIPTGGFLSLAGALSVGYSWWKYRRDKAKLIAAYSEEPKKLLPFLIKRTKAARMLGRFYYLVPWPSVAAGYAAGYVLDPDGSSGAPDAVLFPLLAISLAVMAGITVFGLRLARQKTEQLKELEAMLDEIRGD